MIARALVMIGLVASVLGCGESSGLQELTGKVTQADGSPLARSRMIFHSGEAENYSASTDENGYYSAGSTSGQEGIAPGAYTITIIENRGDIDHPKPATINAKYNLANKSDLKVVVPDADKHFDIVLDPP